jgi:hypothetical protein
MTRSAAFSVGSFASVRRSRRSSAAACRTSCRNRS